MPEQQVLEKQKVTYPVTDPKQFGSPYWFVMHNTAATYPENPTRQDKMQYGMFMRFMLSHLPCPDPCRYNALEYNRQHPFDYSTRERFFRDTVDFHNHTNEITGKTERHDYKDLLTASHECTNCDVNKGNTPAQPQGPTDAQIPQEEGQDMKESIELYKKTVRSMAEQMAKERGKPAPEIEFDGCPDGSDTSCITQDGTIFLNPNNFSLNTFFHEMDHYFELKEGRTVDDSANGKADKYAQEMIEKSFGLGNNKEAMGDSTKPVLSGTGNTSPTPPKVPLPVLAHESRRTKKRKRKQKQERQAAAQQLQPQPQPQQVAPPPDPYKQVVHDVYGSAPYMPAAAATAGTPAFEQMPQFRAALMEVQRQETEEKLEKFESSGVLSFLDPIYDYPASIMGVDREDLNLIQTPVILTNVILTIVEAYTTPIAGISFSFIMGIILMLSGIFLHGKVPPRDVLFIEMLGSLFFWDTARTLNPKKLYLLKKEIDRIQEQRTGGSDPFGQAQPMSFKREIFETPGAFQERDQQRDAPQPLSDADLREAGKMWLKENRPGAKFGVLAGMPMSPSDQYSYEAGYQGQPSPYDMNRRRREIRLPPYSIRDRYL